MNDNCQSVTHLVEAATSAAGSLDDLGCELVSALAGHIPYDRFNIGRIDQSQQLFYDEFVSGQNVAGRASGHQRTLEGSVVDAAIQAGSGFYFGNRDLEPWLERFPRFAPVFDSGIRSMLAVPMRHQDHVVATLVFASCDPLAYNEQNLALAIAAGDVIASSEIFHALFCE